MSGIAFYRGILSARRRRCRHVPPSRRCPRCEGGAFVIPATPTARVRVAAALGLGSPPTRCLASIPDTERN